MDTKRIHPSASVSTPMPHPRSPIVKRPLVLVVLSLAVALIVAAPASAAQTKADKVTAKSKPKTDKKSPFKFTISGTVLFPARYCAPGATPGGGPANCIPITCGPGVTNAAYCAKPGGAQLCAGKVRVLVKRGSRTWGKKTAKLKANCTFKIAVTLKKKVNKKRLNYGTLKVSTRFLGNTVLKARSAKTLTVRGGKPKKQ